MKELHDDIGILSLPEKLLTKIFLHFPRNFNLRNVGLVCRRFLQVVRLPIFVPHQKIISLEEDDESRAICQRSLVEIINILKIYPECKLQLSLSKGIDAAIFQDYSRPSKMISFRNLEPYFLSISTFDLHIGLCEDDLTVIPSLVNLESLNLHFTDYKVESNYGSFCGIYSAHHLFWEKFPNLVSLSLGVHPNDEPNVSLFLKAI